MKLEEALEEYLIELKVKKLSPQTQDSYKGKLTAFVNSIGVKNLEDVKPIHIKEYILKRQEANVKANSINTELRIISGMFNYFIDEYEDEEIIDSNPCMLKGKMKTRRLKESKKVMKAFSEEDVEELYNLYKGKGYFDVRNKTILMVFAETGIRMTELFTIEMKDVSDNRILIHGKGDKERYVPISSRLKKQLLKYERARKKFMSNEDQKSSAYFVSKHKKKFGKRGLQQVAKDINGTIDIEGCFHNFRRYFAVKKYLETRDIYRVRDLLGHSDVVVTQRYVNSIDKELVLGME